MSDVELKISANLDDALKGVSGFRQEFSKMVREVEKPLRKVDTLRALQESAKKTSAEFFATKRRIDELKTAIAAAGQTVPAFERELAKAERTSGLLRSQLEKQNSKLKEHRAELRAAGVDTRDLAGEQQRLQAELAKRLGAGSADASMQAAMRNLGVEQFRGARTGIAELQQQFQLLKASGTASTIEIALAQQTLRSRIAEAARQTNGLKSATDDWRNSLSRTREEIIAGAAAFGGFALIAGNSFSKFADYEQQIAAIGTITDMTDGQLQAMSGSVKQLSLDMGVNATASAKALYDILGSGGTNENAMDILALSTKAAIAGMTETKTAAQVGMSMLNAYGESSDKLGQRFDQLFMTVKDGVISFEQLAQGLGSVMPAAAAAGVPIEEVLSSLSRLTVQGIQAPQAITALQGAINQLAAPSTEAAKAMDEMGIKWNGLAGTLQQIADKKIGFEAMRQIIPDSEGRTAVLALTKDIQGLQESISSMQQSAGATEDAYSTMANTPQAQVERFKAAVDELQKAFGAAVAAGLPVVNLLTGLFNAFNALPEPAKNALAGIVLLGAGTKATSMALNVIRGPLGALVAQLSTVPAAGGAAGAAVDALSGRVNGLGKALKGLGSLGGMLRLGGYGVIASQLMELYSIHEEVKALTKSQEEHAKGLQDLIDRNDQYKGALIATQAEVEQQTETERKGYVERLQAAASYYQALGEQISRADASDKISPEAVDAYRKATAYRNALRELGKANSDRESGESAHSARLKSIKEKELESIKKQLAAQLAAYDKANEDVEQARKRREEIEREFADLARDIGGSGRNDWGGLQDAQLAARQALTEGNTAEAIEQARRAGEILREMQQAGESTYGFQGIAQELGKIASEAARLDEQDAQGKADAIKSKIEGLLQYADALKRVSVGFETNAESEEQTKQRLLQLAQEWSKYMVIRPTIAAPEADPNLKAAEDLLDQPAAPGFAAGGYTGPGGKWQPAGVVHAGEHVQPQEVVREPGALAFLERIRREGFQRTLRTMQRQLRGYATGGFVAPRAMPSIPSLSTELAAAASGPNFPDLGRLDLSIGDLSGPVYVEQDFAKTLHKLALQRGRTSRR
ncbi:phage tail tape measure protein [Pseudomonas sp. MAP12]|uniref:Phage tail tape measure protein n=1 Tax=Geopseudomonas aromaticivorans TaxID=2849492 RepID=A0ABS6MTB8_9GAMM|nr:phage tail tape measure protein [Pseudomonas aromaticivorans]MBV2132051.1 phage tail tape measure protein [Pseudomonas aromaticivorans]